MSSARRPPSAFVTPGHKQFVTEAAVYTDFWRLMRLCGGRALKTRAVPSVVLQNTLTLADVLSRLHEEEWACERSHD
jgi:hypothetical protein